MAKKFYKQILEAVNRGIQLALDDYQNIESNNSISQTNNVIDADDYVGDRVSYNKLLEKFFDQMSDRLFIKVSKDDMKNIASLSKKLNMKFEVKDNRFLQDIIKTVCRIDQFADLNWIDTSKIKDFGNLFNQTLFDGDISEWNTHNVKNMYSCFAYSEFNGDISNWDVSNVENMDWMFEKSQFNKPIGNWDVSKVNSMNGMFSDSQFNQDISNWNTKNCTFYTNFCTNSHLKKINRPKFWQDPD